MYDPKTSIEGFLEALAARQPTPGGGSVTALVGCLAAGMGEMVINYSLGKKSLAQYESELKPALIEYNKARRLLQELMVEDQQAYESLQAARKLPEQSPDRKGALHAAVAACIRVPQAIAATSVAVLELCDRILNFVNYHLLSDLAVCSDLAMASTRCAVYNVRVNLAGVSDSHERVNIEGTNSRLLSRAALIIQHVSPRIWERHNRGV